MGWDWLILVRIGVSHLEDAIQTVAPRDADAAPRGRSTRSNPEGCHIVAMALPRE